jgi:hypothetical protein
MPPLCVIIPNNRCLLQEQILFFRNSQYLPVSSLIAGDWLYCAYFLLVDLIRALIGYVPKYKIHPRRISFTAGMTTLPTFYDTACFAAKDKTRQKNDSQSP